MTGDSPSGPAPHAEQRPPIDLAALFAPRSVAIVGASPRSDIAQTVRDNLRTMGSATSCYFVNPKYDEAWGSPCYPDLASLPEVPDSVLVAVNPLRAASVTEEAARAGARSVLIPGGGVVEGGEAAARMQRDVREIALRHGLAILGPNCMGMIDRVSNSAVYIGDINPWAPRGHVAGIAQSGSVTDAFIHFGTRIGFSRIIGAGSEVVLDVCDYLGYCLDDPETDAVILFVEGFKRPERFLALADRALAMGKPVIVLKVGHSPQAQAAAVAHSGSLAGEARVTDAALAAAGVVRCNDLDALFEAAELHAGCRRMSRGVGLGRTGIVTVSTGEASLIADIAQRTGTDLPPVPEAARAAILADLPTLGYIGNPIDPWGADRRARRLPGRARGIRGLGRLRRRGHRPRLPVSLAAQRGRRGRGRRPGADRGDGRPPGGPAGVPLADLGRADPRDPGDARRRGRDPVPAGNQRSPRGDRRPGRLGGRPCRPPGDRPAPGRVARAGARPDLPRP